MHSSLSLLSVTLFPKVEQLFIYIRLLKLLKVFTLPAGSRRQLKRQNEVFTPRILHDLRNGQLDNVYSVHFIWSSSFLISDKHSANNSKLAACQRMYSYVWTDSSRGLKQFAPFVTPGQRPGREINTIGHLLSCFGLKSCIPENKPYIFKTWSHMSKLYQHRSRDRVIPL